MKNTFTNLFQLLMEQLTDKQKSEVDKFTKKRKADLDFGPIFKQERTYFPLKTTQLETLETPTNILTILNKGDYYCPDYRTRICL